MSNKEPRNELAKASQSVLFCRSCEIEQVWKEVALSFAQLAMSTDDLETIKAIKHGRASYFM